MKLFLPIGVTGGAASGKSTAARLLADLLGALLFDADACVGELFGKKEFLERIAALFPETVAQGHILRPLLRERILRNEQDRHQLEAILHPAVYAACEEARTAAAAKGLPLVAEIPLLLETEAQDRFQPIVLVAASPAVQRRRLAQRGLSEAEASALLKAQWSVEKKLPSADYVIWNDGTLAQLTAQVEMLHVRLAPTSSIP